MDKYDPKNIDPRPKRRRDKDNPYRLFTVGINTDCPHFYVEFIDSHGIKVCTEVGRSVWEMLDRFELEDKKYMNEVERHHDLNNHDAFFLLSEDDDMTDKVSRKIVYELLCRAIDNLPDKQRRRIILYYFYGLTYEQIAEVEGCSKVAVKYSIGSALRKIKEKILF